MRRQLRSYHPFWWKEKRIWEVPNIEEETVQRLQKQLLLSSLLSKVLCGRGITTHESAVSFLFACGKDLPEPKSMPGISSASQILAEAVQTKKPILVHGDYDADGINATAILCSTLSKAGGRIYYFVPNRHKHGYGVSEEAINSAKRAGIKVLVTVDCGITAVKELTLARQHGIATIIVDHHEPKETLPPVEAVINPKLPKSSYPFPDLCASALSLKLAHATLERMGKSVNLENLPVELAALATVTDVMPLIGENRVLVREGLSALRTGRHLGLKTLMEVSGMDAKNVRSYHLGFILGPRLNAAGRMDDPKPALQLLLTMNSQEALSLSQKLDAENRKRQREEEMALRLAIDMVESEFDLTKQRVIVLTSTEWHPGVIGIVAARLVEIYHRPVFLITLQDGIGHGSARSVNGFSVADALNESYHFLLSGGGHKAAGGFKIAYDQLPGFCDFLNELAQRWLSEDDLLRKIRIDAVVTADELNIKTVSELSALEPTGYGNPKPVLVLQNAKIVHTARDGNRLSIGVQQGERVLKFIGDEMIDAISDLLIGEPVHICFSAESRNIAGIPTLDLQIIDFCHAYSDVVTIRPCR